MKTIQEIIEEKKNHVAKLELIVKKMNNAINDNPNHAEIRNWKYQCAEYTHRLKIATDHLNELLEENK